MASFTERIRLIFDVDSKGATTGFRGFASSVKQAEGLTGKMKAGVGSLSATLKDNMAGAALTAGAALVAFGVKAVGVFTDTAKAAIDLSKATGLSVEEASRLIAVGDDLGVTAEALTAGLGKIAKTLDGTQWAKYGVATKDAAGNTRSTNDIFLDALETIGKITNETDRAAAGNELFGKGYANLAPIVGKTREEMEDYLASVEAGQVITEKEAKKAERMRLAMDQLNDALGEVTLAVGGMVAGMAPAIERTADMIEKATQLEDKLGLVEKAMQALDLSTPLGMAEAAWSGAVDEGKAFADMTANELIANVDKYVESTEEATTAVEQWAAKNKPTEETLLAIYAALGLVVPKEEDATAATEDLTSAVDDQKRAWQKLDKTLSDSSMFESTMLGLNDIRDELADIDKKVADGSITWEEAGRLRTLALNDQKAAVNRLVEEVLKLPAETATEINVLIDQGKFDEAKAKLDSLKVVNTSVSAGITAVGGKFGQGASMGGVVGAAVVNNIYVNAMVADGNTGRMIAQALAAYYRNGGSRP